MFRCSTHFDPVQFSGGVLLVTNDLSSHVVARMTHDLANPLGAIGNGVELLELISGTQSPELALIQEATATAQARLRLMRVAFGATSTQSRTLPEMLADWNLISKSIVQSAGDIHKKLLQKTILAVMCCGAVMPMGGTISLDFDGPNLVATAQADRFLDTPDVWAHLEDPSFPFAPTASTIHVNFLAALLARDGQTAQVTSSADSVILSIPA